MERLYNALLNAKGVEADMLKKHIDKFLRDIADSCKIDNYDPPVSVKTKSITK